MQLVQLEQAQGQEMPKVRAVGCYYWSTSRVDDVKRLKIL
jgi:hypothetical protein